MVELCLIFAALLLFEAFQFAALTIQFGLVRIDLALLIGLPDLLSLELIADQRSSAQTEGSADCSARSGMANSSSNQAPCGRAAQCTDSCAFFTGRQ
jgi:hypothetical protein